MTETVIRTDAEPAINEELLEEAQRHLGGAWPNEAINAALLELVEDRRARRRAALERMQQMSDEGLFDFSALDKVDE